MTDAPPELSTSPGRPEITNVVTRGVVRLSIALGWAPLLEVGLPNGRRADVLALSAKSDFVIIEVKSGEDDFKSDAKWPDYQPFCDQFYFAVAPNFPLQLIPADRGLIVADGFGGAVLRDAVRTPLAPARRRSLMINFARLAAFRACDA